ncbi:MAG: RluA family pseudouridine synthase [Deltaproteobacteria bacterium]|nr:RluA family pseudouridine synthase [Deltaproteobacteria bacterium]
MPELNVDTDGAGQRLDRFLQKIMPGMHRGHLFKMLRTRKVRVNGKRARGELRLAKGDRITLHMDPALFEEDTQRKAPQGNRIDFGVVHEDKHLLVVNKPPMLAVHPGAGHDSNSLIDQIHTYLEVDDRPTSFRPSLAHRLDKDTSGLIMVGKDAETLRRLSKMFQARDLTKKYLALVPGRFRQRNGVWEMEVERKDVPGSRKSNKPPSRGRKDKTGTTAWRVGVERRLKIPDYKTLPLTLLVLTLLTGRTHQIRSHLLQAGHPIVGDPRYGDRDLNRLLKRHFALKRQFLHAYRLNLKHPITNKDLKLSAPYPADLLPLVQAMRLGVPA